MKSKVLTVDDDALVVDGLTMLLQLEDIDSAGASDRLSAQALMSGTFHPGIIADVRLRTANEGLKLLDQIRRVSPSSCVLIDEMIDRRSPVPDRAISLKRAEGRGYGEVSLITGLPLGSSGPMYLPAKKKMNRAMSARSQVSATPAVRQAV
jgi:CheY-like chemotaxis protein